MSFGTPDPYYQPEHFGLTKIEEIDDPGSCYSFEMFVLWRHQDGRLFYAIDSGCSCPSPFEGYTSLDDLTELTDGTWGMFADSLVAWCRYNDEGAFADQTKLARHEMYQAAVKALAAA